MKQAHPTLGKYRNHNSNQPKKFGLNRSLLPDVLEYLQARGIAIKGKGVWREILCPFHNDSSPSLRINTIKGCFKCMACDAKGGDLIAFHQKLTGKPFIEACKDLGAWENHNNE